MGYKSIVPLFFCCFLYCFQVLGQFQENTIRKQIHLKGNWRLKLDPTNIGITENWQNHIFKEIVNLPGSLEENGKGKKVEQTSSKFLNQTWQYIGAAWYQKEIVIPSTWKDKQLQLFLERTKVTQVWIDNQFVGGSTLLSAPQVYNLSKKLTPGKHILTIMVNNSPQLVAVGGSHALSEHTQTNWNGIIGKMYLEAAADQLHINWIKVATDVKQKVANVQVSIRNLNPIQQRVVVELQAKPLGNKSTVLIKPIKVKLNLKSPDTLLNITYPLGKDALLWNEYHPNLYNLTVNLHHKNRVKDQVSTNFGLREFKAVGTQFKINEVITFLRGKNESCIFPLTGYPPMETAAWQRLYRIAKTYGINHYRFHSYTPPAAAFEAADREGIYIQAELPNWKNYAVKDTFHTNFQYLEGKAIADAYGNHPSFVMFTLGNEHAGEESIPNQMVKDLRNHDHRRLYANGSNAFYDQPKPGANDDFWVTMRTGKESPTRTSDVRGSFATTEDVGNGILNSWKPSTRYNFSSAISGFKLPIIGHEMGQFQIYPDYKEMSLYKGILRPLNFGIFKERLEKAGMGDQAADFFRASGKLTALLYREEIEMALRTPGFGGFQLLDLQDYPGQGTALVGLLNAFMENKGLITPEEFRMFNNDVVIQLLMDRYIWTNNQTYQADVQLVNYSDQNIRDKELNWSVITAADKELASGQIVVKHAPNGQINPLGQISFPLNAVSTAEKLEIKLSVPGTSYQAIYPVWVYPNISAKSTTNVKVVKDLDQHTLDELNKGGRVLYFPDHAKIKDKSVGPQFIAEFWNWLVFKGAAENVKRPVSAGTLGLLTDPGHPIFNNFPTEFHTNWQWWSIVKNARPLILDKTNAGYRPIVQVIDNIDRNHKLGLIFEFKTGKGKLLVCMANLPGIIDQPEACQLYNSLLEYAESDEFNPQESISPIKLKELF